ncbi:hypothetical protein C9374_012178 [Naegleria lovaniensis]|uniref:Transmembrane protein n=1 Tax=Naegleria lovaniensis TaxID=51637 RepID=A0AA88GF45_NAELO|nr:uncharacterized protein C9374_012178 [Naegleria lovaniensis]KAG2373439.1 hypothetical protein C9374_012178 [Naegleria lovaniensis]
MITTLSSKHSDSRKTRGTILSLSPTLALFIATLTCTILFLFQSTNAQYSLQSVDSLLTLSSSDCSVQVLEKFTFSFSTPYSVLTRALPSSDSLPYTLQLDQSADIFIESPDVTLYSQTLLISNDGKYIVFRVSFADPKELVQKPQVSIVYSYRLKRGPVNVQNNKAQVKWHTLFGSPVSRVSFSFAFEESLYESIQPTASIDSYHKYSNWMEGVKYTILNFNSTLLPSNTDFIVGFNATNTKFAQCVFSATTTPYMVDFMFVFLFIILPVSVFILLSALMCLLGHAYKRWSRHRMAVHNAVQASANNLDDDIIRRQPMSPSLPASHTPTLPSSNHTEKGAELRTQQTSVTMTPSGLNYVVNTVNNHETNDGFTGVVLPPYVPASYLTDNNSRNNRQHETEAEIEPVQYTPSLVVEENNNQQRPSV